MGIKEAQQVVVTRKFYRWKTSTCISLVMHAMTANNALSALIDNHFVQEMSWVSTNVVLSGSGVVDLNDRALRHVTVGLGSPPTVFRAKMVLISRLLLKSWRFLLGNGY